MATDLYTAKIIATIKDALRHEGLDSNPTEMDGHPNTLLIEDETGTLYTVTVEEG